MSVKSELQTRKRKIWTRALRKMFTIWHQIGSPTRVRRILWVEHISLGLMWPLSHLLLTILHTNQICACKVDRKARAWHRLSVTAASLMTSVRGLHQQWPSMLGKNAKLSLARTIGARYPSRISRDWSKALPRWQVLGGTSSVVAVSIRAARRWLTTRTSRHSSRSAGSKPKLPSSTSKRKTGL